MEVQSLHKCLLGIPSLEHTAPQLAEYPLSHRQVPSSSRPTRVFWTRSLLSALSGTPSSALIITPGDHVEAQYLHSPICKPLEVVSPLQPPEPSTLTNRNTPQKLVCDSTSCQSGRRLPDNTRTCTIGVATHGNMQMEADGPWQGEGSSIRPT